MHFYRLPHRVLVRTTQVIESGPRPHYYTSESVCGNDEKAEKNWPEATPEAQQEEGGRLYPHFRIYKEKHTTTAATCVAVIK